MTIKTILVAASGGSATGGAIDLACRLAQRFRAHLEGYHAILDPAAALAVLGEGAELALTGSVIESILAQAQVRAEKTRSLFAKILIRREISLGEKPHAVEHQASAFWRQETGYAPTLVANRARFFDLAVLGRSERVVGQPYTNTIEEVLVHSGRPVLLAPAEAPTTCGKTVAIAWNGSPQAVRALAVCVPFLTVADRVWLITAGLDERDSTTAAIEYLAWHGITAQHHDIADRVGYHIAGLLLDAAQSCSADLFIMGGYGHSLWREALFGGTTRGAVKAMRMPLLLMH